MSLPSGVGSLPGITSGRPLSSKPFTQVCRTNAFGQQELAVVPIEQVVESVARRPRHQLPVATAKGRVERIGIWVASQSWVSCGVNW